MGWFDEPYEKMTAKELQAQLKGICYRALAQGYLSSQDANRYELIVAELARRGIEPENTIKSKAA